MMSLIDRILDSLKWFLPPEPGASTRKVQRWRFMLAGLVLLNSLGLSVHIALACGFASPFYSGFAQAEVVQQIKSTMDSRRMTELVGLMLDTKAKHCAAVGEAKKLYLNAYTNLRLEYYNMTRTNFPDPPCSDFQ